MGVNWTCQQLEAIETHGGNILVAAAAGSGKTAVLVERIIRMITDKENPVSVDRLLVLTFTDAAAAEMKRKISVAITKKMEEDPDNEWLREQSIKVSSAPISTIHSYCSRILANNAHLTDLPAEFSLIDETENKLLQRKAVDDVLEGYYSRIDKKNSFRELVVGWGGIKGDDNLREIIIELHNFLRSLAYPKKWIHNVYQNEYRGIVKFGLEQNSVWMELLKRELYKCCEDIESGLNMVWAIVEREVPADHGFYTYYFDMKNSFCDEFSKLKKEDVTPMQLQKLLNGFVIKNAPKKTGLDEEIVKKISKTRDEYVKDTAKKAARLLSAMDEDNILRLSKCVPVVRTLFNIVRQTEKVHQKYKREKSAIDFEDLEHGLLGLLCNESGEETSLCRKMREYYHEILLDEFQDTNILQFEIFSRLSKKEGNLFMVGDVKQCIYKFRNSDPSIFMGLYKSYDTGNGGKLIRLFKNFRSRREVIDSVNYIFSSVMSERVGEIDYTEEEYLINGAEYPVGSGYETEVIITDAAEEKFEDELLEGLAKEEIEVENVADRIVELVCVDKIKVTDTETRELRNSRYGDIAVLCRNKKECNLIENALAQRGIGTVCESGQQYLDSIEILTILSFLQIIDNPLQDIPLIAVMRSPMFRFSADELALIRSCAKGRFYKAVEEAAKENKKAEMFLETLKDFRKCAKYMGTDELVWKICNDLNYLSLVGAMPRGEIRRANIKLLLARCSEYEQGSRTGLFNFMQYIDTLRESNQDLAPAKEMRGDDDCVKIMTIHKSKGLEFPIVFLSGTAKKFQLKDVHKSIIWDEKLGLGLDYVDTRQRVRYSMPFKMIIGNDMASAGKAEEMRLLYVAMTRAKEKLIISAAVVDRDNRWKSAEYDEMGRVYNVFADKINCMRDWVLGAAMKHPSAGELRSYADRLDIIPGVDTEADIKVRFVKRADSVMGGGYNHKESDENEISESIDLARLDYTYKYEKLGSLPVKMSVSELKRRRMPEEDYSLGLIAPTEDFVMVGEEISATERGTITHFVLQHLDIGKTDTKEQIKEQIDGMVIKGIISPEQGESIDVYGIWTFFTGELGKRLKASERYEREFEFYMTISPDEIGEEQTDGADDVLLQGIADMFFYESDGVVLVDYKTDRVSKNMAQERSKKYKLQIEYYAKGIEQILNLPVKEKYLYFLNCGEEIKM